MRNNKSVHNTQVKKGDYYEEKTKIYCTYGALIIIANFSIASSISVYAHESLLNVNYDTCTDSTNDDGIDEM